MNAVCNIHAAPLARGSNRRFKLLSSGCLSSVAKVYKGAQNSTNSVEQEQLKRAPGTSQWQLGEGGGHLCLLQEGAGSCRAKRARIASKILMDRMGGGRRKRPSFPKVDCVAYRVSFSAGVPRKVLWICFLEEKCSDTLRPRSCHSKSSLRSLSLGSGR